MMLTSKDDEISSRPTNRVTALPGFPGLHVNSSTSFSLVVDGDGNECIRGKL
jgi:hypothetical protein